MYTPKRQRKKKKTQKIPETRRHWARDIRQPKKTYKEIRDRATEKVHPFSKYRTKFHAGDQE